MRKGFTLVEMSIVIAILGIVMSMVVGFGASVWKQASGLQQPEYYKEIEEIEEIEGV